MATEIGFIKELVGSAIATAADGSQRTLQVGDKLFADEIVSTGAASAVEIEFADGSIMDLGRNSQAVLDNEVFDPQQAAQAPTQVPDDVEALQQALLDGTDPTLVGEATAAGAGTQAGGNEGHTTVTVAFLAPTVDVVSGFETTGPSLVQPEIVTEDVLDDVPVAIDDGIAGEAGLLDASKTVFEDQADFNSSAGTGLGFINSRGEFVPQQTTTGNILANDSFGANGPGGLVSVTYTGSSAGVTGTLIGGVATLQMADPNSPETGLIWTLTVEPNGDYTFTLNKPYVHSGEGEDIAQELFQYTIQDADGDTASATLTFNIVDDVPHIDDYSQPSEGQESISSTPTAFVDEDDIIDSGNADSANGDDNGNSYVNLPINFGADGSAATGAVILSAAGIVDQNGNPLTSNDVELTYTWDADSGTLTGMAGETTVLTMTVEHNSGSDSYGVQVNLLANLDHPISGTEDNLVINIAYTATDFDGDTVDGSFAVDIDDDMPVNLDQENSIKVGGVQEDALQGGNTEELDWTQHTSTTITAAEIAQLVSAGADAPVTISLNTSATFEGADTGLTQNGLTIHWHVNGSSLEGITYGTGDGIDNTIFTLTPKENGDFTFTLLDNIDHDNDGDLTTGTSDGFVEKLSLANVFVATDSDGDSIVVDAGAHVTIQNDVPTIDKSSSLSLAETDVDNNGFDVKSVTSALGHINEGADGATVTNMSLAATVDYNNLESNGQAVTATQDGNVITGALEDGTVVFTMTYQPNGEYTFTQNRPLDHQNNDTLIKLGFNYTVTDSDGDTASSILVVSITDDVPVITSQAIQSELLLQESFENFRNSDGWNVEGEGGATIVGDHGVVWTTNEAGIEIQRGNVGGSTASDGQSHAELDANDNNHDGGTTLTVLSTSINLPYSEATLSFDYKPRPDDKAGSDMKVTLGEGDSAITVTLDSQSYGTVNITSDNGVTVTQVTNPANGWITVTLNYGGLALGATTLSFAGLPDANGGSNTLGAYIDNINMTANAFGLQVDETNLNVDATADFSSLFTSSFGADGAGSIAYTLNVNDDSTGITDTATGQVILLSVNESTGAVEGRTETSGYLVFTLSVDADGKVTLDQQRAVIHTDPANNDDVVSLNPSLINLVATITDADGDEATAEVDLTNAISFRDDGPSVTATQPAAPTYEFTITNHDEVSSASHHNSYGYYIKDAVTGEPTSGVVVWDDVHDTDTVPVTVTGYTPEQVGFFIIPNGDNENSGLGDNTPVSFSFVDGQWQAFAGDTPLAGTGAHVFFDNGSLNSDSQNHLVDNGLTGNQNWEDLPIPNGDGDFNDVNINVEWSVANSRPLTVDETELADADEATTASATMALAGSFAVSPGADGLGSVEYVLGLVSEGVDSGLVDTFSDDAVLLRTNSAGDIEGYVADGVVFTLTVDATTGVATLTQSRAIVHGNPEDHDEALTPATIGDDLITLTATVTDGDGDTASDSIDVGALLAFEDDGPVLTSDINSVVEDGETQSVTANVLTNDAQGADGAVVNSIQFGNATAQTVGDAGVTVQGVYGSLLIAQNGTYTYTLNNGEDTVQSLHLDEEKTEQFTYGVQDGDGDTASSTLTVTITGTNDAPVIDGEVSNTTGFMFNGLNAEYYGVNNQIDNLAELRDIVDNNSPDATFRATNINYGEVGVTTGALTAGSNVSTGESLQTFLKNDASTLSADPSDTDNDGGVHIFGQVYLAAGDYQFKVLADDGYQIVIDGNSVAEYAEIQSPTTRTHDSFTINNDGYYAVDMVWWDQGIEYIFQPALSFNGGDFEVFSTENFTFRAEAMSSVIEAGNTDSGAEVAGISTVSGLMTADDIDNDDDSTTLNWSLNEDVNPANSFYGQFAIDADGQWTYTLDNVAANELAEGTSVTETFTVVVTDSHNATDTKDVTITIQGTNDSPIISFADGHNTGAVSEDDVTSITGQLVADDVDLGATESWSIIGNNQSDYGSISVDSTGKWTYTLDNDNSAVQALNSSDEITETYTVRITDDKGAWDDQAVTVTISGADDNHPPVAVNDSATTSSESSNYLVDLGNIAQSDEQYDWNGDHATWTNTDSNGQLVTLTALNFDGSDGVISREESTDYRIGVAGHGHFSGVADQLQFDEVTGQSQALVLDFSGYLNDATFSWTNLYQTEDGGEQGHWAAYLGDKLVGEGDFISASGQNIGNASITTDQVFNKIVFTGIQTETGTIGGNHDSSDYYLQSFQGNGPAWANDPLVTFEDNTIVINAATIMGNDSDPDNDSFTITEINGGTSDTSAYGSDGTTVVGTIAVTMDSGHVAHVELTPNDNYSGVATFNYKITDEHGLESNEATVTINVLPVADAPTLIMSVGEPTVTSTQAVGYQVIDYKGDSYFVGGGDGGILKASTNSTHTTFVVDKGYGIGGGSGVDSIDKNESLMFDLQQEVSSATFTVSVESTSLNAQWIAYDVSGEEVGQGAITSSTGTIVISDIGNFAYVAFDAANGGSENNGGFYVMPVSSVDTTNLIVNGSFEDINGVSAGGNSITGLAEGSLTGSNLVSMKTITGWETLAGAAPMEPHAKGHANVGSTDGNHYMDLGASPGNASIEQTFNTLVSGQTYQLSFDFRDKAAMQESGDAGLDSGVMNVVWNGIVIATVEGNNVDNWESLTVNVTSTGNDSLVFAEVGVSDDNWGIAIDNVELFSVYEYNDAPETSYSYDLSIIAALTDLDGSESLSGITVSNLPDGVSISTPANGDGTYAPGTLTLVSDHELTGVEINEILGSVTSTDGNVTETTDSNAKVAADYVDFNALSLASWGGPTQDRAASDATTVTENVLTLAGNSWKAVSLEQLGVADGFDWSNGTLTFETKVTTGGELQGIMFDNNLTNNLAIDQPNLIKVAGTQSWGTNAIYTSEDLGNGWARVEVDLSTLDQSSGVFKNLVFVNDDDNNDPSDNLAGSISFRNLSISDTAIDSSISTDNLLEGTSGNDVLYGDSGNDILIGGAGDDILTGGAGSDIFVWNQEDVSITATPAHDTVIDFDIAHDKLNLADLLSDPSVPLTIEGIATGADNHLQLNIQDANGFTVQEIELQGVDALALGANANATLQSLLDTGVINDGI